VHFPPALAAPYCAPALAASRCRAIGVGVRRFGPNTERTIFASTDLSAAAIAALERADEEKIARHNLTYERTCR
jgi:hypothetical protein